MKNIKLILSSISVILLSTIMNGNLNAQVSFGKSQLINDGWKFSLFDHKNGADSTLNDKRWQNVDLPHDWSVKGQLSPTLASCTGFLPGGIGWYRKSIDIDAACQGKELFLYFEGVYNRSEVYINGHLLGKRPNGYISFMYNITPYVNYNAPNYIAVRVDHSKSSDSRWYTGSGIYRNVWLVSSNPLHISEWGVNVSAKDVSQKQATVDVAVDIENNTKQSAKIVVRGLLVSRDGSVAAQYAKKVELKSGAKTTVTTDLKVTNPQLWSLDNPNLYTLKTTITEGKETIDQSNITTGIRKYTFDPNKGFALNDKFMKIKGVCIHHDAGVLGSAVPREVWEQRLKTLKSIGVNAIRTSHNPQSPDLYALCDELGMLVMNEAYDEWEFAKRKWVEGWNKGTPSFQGNFDYFEQWGEKDLADMIRRDRNHVSIFAWSIGNEVDYPNDPYSHPVLDGKSGGFTQPIFGGYKKDAPDAMRLGVIAKKLAAVVRRYDTSRPVTAGLAGVAMSNQTEYPAALDIAGYNYTESMYQKDHKQYPNRVIYGSENRHDIQAWQAVINNEYIFGQFLWTGIDYLGESGAWPSRGFYSGLLDFGGSIKPRGYFRQSLWTDKPMAYLGTYPTPGHGNSAQTTDVWSALENENNSEEKQAPSMDAWSIWNYREGQSIRVVCYTNCEKAKLLLNDKEVGVEKPYDKSNGIIYWDIPYSEGKLEVVASGQDGKTARYSIISSTEPYAIVTTTKTNTVSCNGTALITIQIVDKKGNDVMLADNDIHCQIVGNGSLLGLEASNNSDMSDYTDHSQRVFNGKMLAYIKAGKKAGNIKIRFSSPWLKSSELTINVTELLLSDKNSQAL